MGIANKDSGWTPFTALICLHHRFTSVSPIKMGIYELFRALLICLYHLYLPISQKVLGIANKQTGWTTFTASLIGLHHRITLVSPTKKGVYKLFRAL